jgi:hypothetical protein
MPWSGFLHGKMSKIDSSFNKLDHGDMDTIMKQKKSVIGVVGILVLAALINIKATPYMVVATFSYALMVMGILNRRQGQLHAKLMGGAISIDIVLVLVLEVLRSAIATAVGNELNLWQQLHVVFSTLAVVLYFPLIFVGLKNLKHESTPEQKKWHRNLGFTAFALRSIGFVLMFSMLDRHL